MQSQMNSLAKRHCPSTQNSLIRPFFRLGLVSSKSLPWTALRMVLLLAAFGLITVGVTSTAIAQQIFGSIDGNVVDGTGAAVVGGVVTITETTKGVTFTQKTNASGFYSQGQLIPGTYTVTVEATGFKKAVSTPLSINVDQVSRFDATLSLGSATETVQVTSAAPQLETDRVDIATTLSSDQILALPEYQRNFLALEFLTPGVLVNSSSTSTAENPQGSFRARVNGQMWGTTGYQLDGTDNQDAWLGSAIINPDPDSVAESRFSTQNFDAENGYVAGGMFVASTKSGSNQIHGSLFEYLINNSPGFRTVAINPFTPTKVPPPLKSNQFGGSIGGSIIKDKLFYFGDIEIQRRREGETLQTTVPTALVHQSCGQAAGNCDLSEYLNGGTNQIYDPATGVSRTGQGRSPFVNNQIPVSRISPQALKLLQYFPLPNFGAPGAYKNNYIATGAQTFNAQQYNARIDYYLNDKNLFFARYTHAGFNLSVPGAFGYLAGGPGLDSSGFSGSSVIANQSLSAGYTHIFNPNFINESRLGFIRYNVHELPGGYGTTPATDAGIPNLNLDNTVNSGMPAFNVTGDGGVQLGYSNTINRCNCTLTEIETEFQLVDNLTKVVGNHTLKFGTDLKRTGNLRAPSDTHRSGELTFAPGYTGLGNANGGAGGGLGLATFLLGKATTFGRYESTVNDATAYLERAHFYGQDTWHPAKRITLSYGLRWELTFPEATDPGKGGLLDLNTGNVVVFGVGGNSSRGFQQMNYHNFAPRFGMAYQATPKTVLRVGYGWAYSAGWAGSVFNQANISLPVLLAQSLTPANASQKVVDLAVGPPNQPFPTIDSSGMAPLPNNITQSTRPHQITLPVVYSYNAAIQQQLTKSIAVTAAYVGNSGRHTANDTLTNFNVNQAPFVPGVTNLNSIKPYFAKYGWTQAINYYCNCAVTQYNALQASIDVRHFHGYTAQGTYTYQYAYGDGYGPNQAYTSYTMLYNRPLGYGNEANTPHTQVIIVQDYEIPYGKGHTFGSHAGTLATSLLGGWRVAGTTNFMSGLPFTAIIGSYPAGYAAPSVGPPYPNRGTASPFTGAAHNRTQWFVGARAASLAAGTATSFSLPAPNTFGNNGFDDLYGPININQDLALMKSVTVAEKYKFTLRTDAFNLFNHANLGLPDATITDSNAGQITSLGAGANMRRLQFALRMDF